MTELEEKLLDAFSALSKQYEEEQLRQSKLVARLSRQIADLNVQVQLLAGARPIRGREEQSRR